MSSRIQGALMLVGLSVLGWMVFVVFVAGLIQVFKIAWRLFQ